MVVLLEFVLSFVIPLVIIAIVDIHLDNKCNKLDIGETRYIKGLYVPLSGIMRYAKKNKE